MTGKTDCIGLGAQHTAQQGNLEAAVGGATRLTKLGSEVCTSLITFYHQGKEHRDQTGSAHPAQLLEVLHQ